MAWKNKYKRQQKYYYIHKAEIIARAKPLINKEKQKEYNKRYYLKHPELRQKHKEWYIKKRGDKYKTRGESSKELSREKKQIRQTKYWCRKKGAVGTHTVEEWKAKKKEFNYCCAICGKKEPFEDQHFKKLTEDHIIPLSKGGSNYIENIQPACHKCNCLKQDKI